MSLSHLPSSNSLNVLRVKHEATNTAVKVAAVAFRHLAADKADDDEEFAKTMGDRVSNLHPSWGPAQFSRSATLQAEAWMIGAALVRATACLEAYTTRVTKTIGVPDEDAENTCRSVRQARAAASKLAINDKRLKDLCESVNWFAAIRNAVCHGNKKIVSARRAHAQIAWSRIHTYFKFADKAAVPAFPHEVVVTWPLVILASVCCYEIAQTLDSAACSKYGTDW